MKATSGPAKPPSKTPPKKRSKQHQEQSSRAAEGDAAWTRVTAQTRPLNAAKRDVYVDADKTGKKPAVKKRKEPDDTLPRTARAAAPKGPAMPKQKAKPPPRPAIEQKARRRLSRGRVTLDATLDMHGMSLREAEAALRGFVAHHRAQGHQWVLVITGKGVRGEGRLRQALPDWLATAPLAAQIVEYDIAGIPHGGGGAFYLRLRRA
jgi:DNA-nicking Smr family endonuclease